MLALVLLVGIGYAIYVGLTRDGTGEATTGDTTTPGVVTDRTGGPGHGHDVSRRDEIAARPMLAIPDSASEPTEVASAKAETIKVPEGTGLAGPALVATGFPHTPKGAIGQLAQIDTAVLSSMSPQTAREVYSAWALPGGVAAADWWTAASVDSFLASSGTGEAMALAPGAVVTVEPAGALVKGTDGPDWAAVCVLMRVRAIYRSEAQVGWGHCERMQWVGGRWMIAPGTPPASAPSTWPGSALALKAGWRTWRETSPTKTGGER